MTALLPRGAERSRRVVKPAERCELEVIDDENGVVWIEERLTEYRWNAVSCDRTSVSGGEAPTRRLAIDEARRALRASSDYCREIPVVSIVDGGF